MNLLAKDLKIGDVISYNFSDSGKRILAIVVADRFTAPGSRTEALLYQLVNNLDEREYYSSWINGEQSNDYNYQIDPVFKRFCVASNKAWWNVDVSCKKIRRRDNLLKNEKEMSARIAMLINLFKWEYSIRE